MSPAGLKVLRKTLDAFSLGIAVAMTVVSLSGRLYGSYVYPTDELLAGRVPLDLFNFAVGLPILLGSVWLARRGKSIGPLCWPGALLYVLCAAQRQIVAHQPGSPRGQASGEARGLRIGARRQRGFSTPRPLLTQNGG